MANEWAKIDASNLVVNVEVAEKSWVDSYQGEYRYVTAHYDLPEKAAIIGGTYDEDTTWFIPPKPGEDWYFDREAWVWVDPNPPKPQEESQEPTD